MIGLDDGLAVVDGENPCANEGFQCESIVHFLGFGERVLGQGEVLFQFRDLTRPGLEQP